MFTLAEVERLMEKDSRTDESLNGRYFWCRSMVVTSRRSFSGSTTTDRPPPSETISKALDKLRAGASVIHRQLNPEPSPRPGGTPALFCQRQNSGPTGPDDHYRPVS
ncbi:hypothetical protein ACFW21_20145 [Streptomyces albogriseolus]|uniref:hypothetical protein n=1 Tax=Streptomyces albogriseolus TaxID=1887 RepID=UPI0036910DF9